MPQSVSAPRGVRDITPDQRVDWRRVEQAARQVAESFGFEEVETPILEMAALVERLGAGTDVVQKELYRTGSHDDLVLRPEATAGVMRAYFQNGLHHGPRPARLYLLGPMFRHDAPQAGRYRQFYQFDVEAIGEPAAALDAELIEVAWRWLGRVGLTGASLHLNSIGDAKCRPAYLEELKAYYRPLADRLDPNCRRRLETNPLRLLDCKVEQCQPFKAGAPRITDHLCLECSAAFAEVGSLLAGAGIPFELDPYLVRGLDYYTRTVFEFQDVARGGAQNALGGGGRYDGLAAELGWPDTPAVGFAMGLDRVVEALDRDEPPGTRALLAVLPDGSGLAGAGAEVGRVAREEVPTVVDHSDRSLKAKMRDANRRRARWVAIFNEEEAAERLVQLRDMASGEQRATSWAALPAALRESGS